MKTVFEPCDPDTIYRLYAEAAELEVTPGFRRDLDRALCKWRKELLGEDEENIRKSLDQYWFEVNTEVLRDLNTELPEGERFERGQKLRQQITSDPLLYVVREDTLQALERLSEFVRGRGGWLVFASNQPIDLLNRFLEDPRFAGLADLFDRRYTPSNLHARKPFPGFWYALRGSQRTPKSILAMIGNSLQNDAAAAKLDIPTHLLDRDGSRRTLIGRGIARSGLPNWVHYRYLRNQIFCYPDPNQLVDTVMAQLRFLELQARSRA